MRAEAQLNGPPVTAHACPTELAGNAKGVVARKRSGVPAMLVGDSCKVR